MILSLQMACQTEHALLLIYRKFLHVLSNTAPAYFKRNSPLVRIFSASSGVLLDATES